MMGIKPAGHASEVLDSPSTDKFTRRRDELSLGRVIPAGRGMGRSVGGPHAASPLDPSYTDRLANFLRSLGQAAIVAGPGQLEVDLSPTGPTPAELEIYLRVWRVLYPDAEVQLDGDDAERRPVPAA